VLETPHASLVHQDHPVRPDVAEGRAQFRESLRFRRFDDSIDPRHIRHGLQPSPTGSRIRRTGRIEFTANRHLDQAVDHRLRHVHSCRAGDLKRRHPFFRMNLAVGHEGFDHPYQCVGRTWAEHRCVRKVAPRRRRFQFGDPGFRLGRFRETTVYQGPIGLSRVENRSAVVTGLRGEIAFGRAAAGAVPSLKIRQVMPCKYVAAPDLSNSGAVIHPSSHRQPFVERSLSGRFPKANPPPPSSCVPCVGSSTDQMACGYPVTNFRCFPNTPRSALEVSS
jgi:hypothetical protein